MAKNHNGKKQVNRVAFAKLTRPDGKPVWVNPVQVAEVTPVLVHDSEDTTHRGKTAIVLAGAYEDMAREVMEECEEVMRLFNSLYVAILDVGHRRS